MLNLKRITSNQTATAAAAATTTKNSSMLPFDRQTDVQSRHC